MGTFTEFLYSLDISDKTIKEHLYRAGVLVAHCQPFTPSVVQQYLSSRLHDPTIPFSRAAHNKYVQTLRYYAKVHQLTGFEIITRKKEQPKRYSRLTMDEIDQFIALQPQINTRFPQRSESPTVWRKRTLFWLCKIYTGARTKELLELTVDCVNLQSGTILFPLTKTGKGREIVINTPLLQPLSDYIHGITTYYVFPREHEDAPMTGEMMLKDFHLRTRRLGIKRPIRASEFRGDFITRSLNNGAGLFQIQDQVGHANSNTTRGYYHGSIEMIKQELKKDPLADKYLSKKDRFKRNLELLRAVFWPEEEFDVSIDSSSHSLHLRVFMK